MSLRSLKSRIDGLARSIPATTGNGARERNASRIRAIATAPAGVARDIAIEMMVDSAVNTEEAANVELLVATIGKDTIARVFPNGVPSPKVCAEVRAATRAYFESHDDEVDDPITKMINETIRRQSGEVQ